MKYPQYLEKRKQEIQTIVSSWPVDVSLDKVMTWILQFDNDDYDIAIRVLKQMNVIGPDELNSSLSVCYSKLLRHAEEKGVKVNKENTIYIPIGTAGKSGSMIAYNFRMINGLNSAYFLSSENVDLIKQGKIENLVIIDDIIATGDQSSEVVKETAEKALRLGISHIFLITAFGFKKGISCVAETQVADVFSAVEYDECDTVFSLDSAYYDGLQYETRKSYRERIQNKYKGLGYKDLGALITFFYNTPNCTIKSVWFSKDGWMPLFPRKHDLTNKSPELIELDELLTLDKDKQENSKKDCAIFVEGKSEELFIAELAKRNNDFGYSDLKVISIGPFYQKSLIEELKNFYNTTIFITTDSNDSEDNPHYSNLKETMDGSRLEIINPIMSYFDVKSIESNDTFSKVVDKDMFQGEQYANELYDYLESRLIKRAFNFRFANMKELLDNCTNKERIEELVNALKKSSKE